MGRRASEFVPNESLRHSATNSSPVALTMRALTFSRPHTERFQIVETSNAVVSGTCRDDGNEVILKRFSPRNDDTHADGSFAMKPLEILKIAIEERVFVVPLDFQGDAAVIRSAHVIDFVGGRGPFLAVDGLPDQNIALDPTPSGQRTSQALGEAGFATAAADQFHIPYPYCRKRVTKFIQRCREILCQDGFRMILGPHVEARAFKIGQSQEDTTMELYP